MTTEYENFLKAHELLRDAGKAREAGNWDKAFSLESEAERLDPSIFPAPEHHNIKLFADAWDENPPAEFHSD